MERTSTVEAWFMDGPADGAIRCVECVDGGPPELLMFCGGMVFVGMVDVPAPVSCLAYELVAAPAEGRLRQYWYVGSLAS